MLDALGAPAGKEDDRSREERYHDALQEAMRRLVAANCCRSGPGSRSKPGRYSLADLMLLDGGSALQTMDRAGAGAVGGPPGVRVRYRQRGRRWLEGDAAEAITCDAAMAPSSPAT